MSLIENNGKTITLGTLVSAIEETLKQGKDAKVYVPMYQRNYKWNQENAIKLVKDLISAWNNGNDSKPKSISLFTLYIDNEKNIQVVDGQQRLITLLLLFTALNEEDKFINLEFERDYSLKSKRSEFIRQKKNTLNNDNLALSDKRRLLYNYQGILQELKNRTCNGSFAEYILNNVTLLLHVTKDKPVFEFLNLNCNKTRFSICDRVRSALITYPTFNEIDDNDKASIASILDCSDYKKGISILFEEITQLLYKDDIYDTVKRGYIDPDKTNENRINILFCNLVNSIEKGYMNCKSIGDIDKIKLLLKLAYYKKMLKELEDDCKTFQTHRAFINFYRHRRIRFFELLDNYIDNNSEENLYDILHKEHSIDKNIVEYVTNNPRADDIYFVNSYFEVLSNDKKPSENSKYSSLLKQHFSTINKEKVKYFSLNKDTFADIAHSSGKYILYRYINEKHTENHNIISLPSTPIFEDTKKIKCTNNIIPLTEITLRELLENTIIIPVIQRDYCMGSHFNQEDKSDMLDYIINNFNKNKPIILSAITILHSQENNIYIYDGQQRIFTLACLLKLLDFNYTIQNVVFEHRDNFNKDINKFFKNGDIEVNNYATKSIINLKKALEKKLGIINKSKLCKYILEDTKFDVVTVNGELSTAEQFFTEINDGVQLVPYEIFKCKINAKYEQLICCNNEDHVNCLLCDIETCPSINELSYKEWIRNIDNEWLDYFYRLNNTQLTDEGAIEELMIMRFIEFCCYMIYWEKYVVLQNKPGRKHPLEIRHFSKDGQDMGDMDILIDGMVVEDFIRINRIVKKLICFEEDTNAVSCIEKDCGSDGVTGFSHYNPINYDENYLIKRFLDSLKNDNLDYHDITIWGILNQYDSTIIKDLMNYWNNKKVNKNNFAVVYPGFIGVWYHVCLPIPIYYTGVVSYKIESALKEELIDDINKEYDDVMKYLCLKNNQNTAIVQWGNNSSRYAEKLSGLSNIAACNVFYYRNGSSTPNKVENKKVVSCNGINNSVILASNSIDLILSTRYENSSKFMKSGWKCVNMERDGNICKINIETSTKKYILKNCIEVLVE